MWLHNGGKTEPFELIGGTGARQSAVCASPYCFDGALLQLLVPSLAHLDAYADALRRGWSPDNVRLEEAAREELELIAHDPAAFVAMLDDPQAKPGPITLPDGPPAPRPPGYRPRICPAPFSASVH